MTPQTSLMRSYSHLVSQNGSLARKIKVKVKTNKSVSCTSGYSWIHASVSQVSGVQVAKVIDSQRLELPEVRVGKKKGSKVKCHRLLGDPYLSPDRRNMEKLRKSQVKTLVGRSCCCKRGSQARSVTNRSCFCGSRCRVS